MDSEGRPDRAVLQATTDLATLFLEKEGLERGILGDAVDRIGREFAAACPPAAIYGLPFGITGVIAAGRIEYFATGTST